MILIPFHFHNDAQDVNFLGILRGSTSRRDKEKLTFHVKDAGDRWNHVLDFMPKIQTVSLFGVFANWLWANDYLADENGPFLVEDAQPSFNMTEKELMDILSAHGYTLRIQ